MSFDAQFECCDWSTSYLYLYASYYNGEHDSMPELADHSIIIQLNSLAKSICWLWRRTQTREGISMVFTDRNKPLRPNARTPNREYPINALYHRLCIFERACGPNAAQQVDAFRYIWLYWIGKRFASNRATFRRPTTVNYILWWLTLLGDLWCKKINIPCLFPETATAIAKGAI